MQTTPRKSDEMIGELHGGQLPDIIAEAIRKAALNSHLTGKPGSVTLKLNIKPLKNSKMVEVEHHVNRVVPESTGKSTNEWKETTPMHVDRIGNLCASAPEQSDLFTPSTTTQEA